MKNTVTPREEQRFELHYAAVSALSPYLLAAIALLLFPGLGT